MPARESESLILRTYPYREADLVVVFLTRDRGKQRGIARGVRRPKSRFGAGLERLSHSRVHYYEKHNLDLTRVDRAELLSPSMTMLADYPTSLALDYIAEVADELQPDHEANEAYFRLLLHGLEDVWQAVLGGKTNGSGDVWGRMRRALTYFALWSVRLGGFLPPLEACLETGAAFGPGETVYFERRREGLLSRNLKGPDSWTLSPQSRALALEMLRKPLSEFADRPWGEEQAADLQMFLNQRLEEHFERRLRTLRLIQGLRAIK